MSDKSFREPMTLCRALRLAVLMLEYHEAEATGEQAFEFKQAAAVLRRECEARQLNPPDYQGVYSGVG